VRKLAYQALGFGVWQGGKWYLHRRYGDAPRKVALGSLLVALLALVVLAGRKASGGNTP
jgi:hypothetical protein